MLFARSGVDKALEIVERTINLTWALVIATYKRSEILPRTLKLAVEQTRPPSEIIVVDASPDWHETRDWVMRGLAPASPGIEWRYVQARRASASAQRNQGIELATADVLFFFDDDSLMYPDCAERIMAVYEADEPNHSVAGVASMLAAAPPDDGDEGEAARPISATKSSTGLRRVVRRVLRADDIFVPYDEHYPVHELPLAVKQLRVGTRNAMAGMTMTMRRPIAEREPFEEILLDRGPEDSDMSYRASRHGALLTALDARVYHVGSPTGRFTPVSRAALGAIGPLVLHRIYSTNLRLSIKRSRRLLWRSFLISLCRDLSQREWRMPNTRGICMALWHMKSIFARDEQQLRAWYPAFQRRLLGLEGHKRGGLTESGAEEGQPSGEVG